MYYFPQLLTGSVAQYPILKQRLHRTLVNELPDGSNWKLLDPGNGAVEWQLTFSSLTSQERDAIEYLFQTVDGRLSDFTFLDPTDNLLTYSEELLTATWTKDAMLQLTEGISDPIGTSRATRVANSATTTQRLQQTINGPSWFHYCLSAYLRSDQPAVVSLTRSADVVEARRSVTVGSSWLRYVHSGQSATSAEGISFGMELEGGAAVEVYGLQVEAQVGASPYRKTGARSGVYTKVRFAEDSLTVTAQGLEEHSCVVRLTAKS